MGRLDDAMDSHEHLVATDSVDIPVQDVFDSRARAQAADGGATALVAPDALDLVVRRRVLDRDALIPVRDLNVVDPDVGARDIDTVRTANVGTADGKVVDFAVLRVVEDDMELGRYGAELGQSDRVAQEVPLTIDENEVVEREVGGCDDAEKARA